MQSDKIENFVQRERGTRNLPILTLEEILNKELALSYYLDYLSILNLQKYVLFYLSAQEWKSNLVQASQDMFANKTKLSRDELVSDLREKARNLYQEYLVPSSANYLSIDTGLIEVLNIRLRDHMLPLEGIWFDSICKFIYEKIKTEEIFLNNFYQSLSYKVSL